MAGREESCEESYRVTIINAKTEDQRALEAIIEEAIRSRAISADMIVSIFEKNPAAKEETPFIQKIFEHPEVVREIADTMLSPSKFNLPIQEGIRRSALLKDFLLDNNDFKELLFLGVLEKSFSMDIWFHFLHEENPGNLPTSLSYFSSFITPFIKYEYSSSSRIDDYYHAKQMATPFPKISLFDSQLLRGLIEYSHNQAIFKFLYNLILVSAEEEFVEAKESDLCFDLLNKLFETASQKDKMEEILYVLKEVTENIRHDRNQNVFFFLGGVIEAKVLQRCCTRVAKSFLANTGTSKEAQGQRADWEEEEEVVECSLKVLSETVKAYIKLQRSEANLSVPTMGRLTKEVNYIFQCLQDMSSLLRVPQKKVLPFSSGQDIKPITLVKYAYFQLLLNCFTLTKEHPQTFSIDVDKLGLFKLISHYYQQNRWNNILHSVLQKLAGLMIGSELIRLQKGHVEDNFLEFLIAAFINKKYVFLNSFRLTSQGNIHSLYSLSKRIAFEMEKVLKYSNFKKNFEYWRTFVADSLQLYELKLDSILYKIDYEETPREDEEALVEIDQVNSIKQLVKKFSDVTVWSATKHGNSLIEPTKKNSMHRSTSNSDLSKKESSQSLLNSPMRSRKEERERDSKMEKAIRLSSMNILQDEETPVNTTRKSQLKKQQLGSSSEKKIEGITEKQ